jgi:hypothetical protein
VLLAHFELHADGQRIFASSDPYPLLLARAVRTAAADAPRGYHRETEFPDRRVPKPRTYSAAQTELIALQAEARALLRGEFGSQAEARIDALDAVLEARYPDEWLLRWNLLEALYELGLTSKRRSVPVAAAGATRHARPEQPSLATMLEAQLERMEIRFAHREPIATGLKYLRARGL